MREPTKEEEGYADVVVDVPEVGSFYFERLNILAGTYFVQILTARTRLADGVAEGEEDDE